MPKLELKAVQRELEQGQIWPFYWVYGSEKLKSRELLKRIKKTVLGDTAVSGSVFGWNEEGFDGNEVNAAAVLDSALSPALGGGVRLIIVRDAHSLKNPDVLVELFGPPRPKSELSSVCVCLAKDLDGRKKFSKVLLDQAAVIPCEEVPENQRESWVLYLAKRHGLELPSSMVVQLCALDPWSLDIVEREMEKLSIAGLDNEVTLEGTYFGKISDLFLESFFSRDLKATLPLLVNFVDRPDESLPLLGLVGWNVRQLAILLADRESGTRHSKLSPFWMDRFRKWASKWKLSEVIELQKELVELDYQMKQSPLLPLGLWDHLVTRFCR
jgi:DNA polymerase III delta subunit